MILFFSILYLLLFNLYSAREGVKVGWFNNAFVFLFLAFLYWVLIPVELYLKSEDGFFKSGSYWHVGKYSIALLATVVSVTIVFFYFNKKNIGRNILLQKITNQDGLELETNISIKPIFRFIAVVALYLIIFRDDLSQMIVSYSSNYELNYNNPLVSFIKYILVMVSAILGYYYAQNNRKIGLLLIIFSFIVGVITFDKDPIVIAIVAGVSVYSKIPSNKKKSYCIQMMVFLSLPLLFLFILSFSAYRANVPLGEMFSVIVRLVSVVNLDPGGPFMSISHALGLDDMLYGETLYNNLSSIIPKVFYPDRPLDLAVEFAQSNIANWSPGMGLGFSSLAEALMNFGVYASWVYYVIIFYIWNIIWLALKRTYRNTELFVCVYSALSPYFILLLFRGTSLDILKIIPFYLIGVHCILYLIGIYRPNVNVGFLLPRKNTRINNTAKEFN